MTGIRKLNTLVASNITSLLQIFESPSWKVFSPL